MDTLEYFSMPLLGYMIFTIIVVIGISIVWIRTCVQMTGTLRVGWFLFNRKY